MANQNRRIIFCKLLIKRVIYRKIKKESIMNKTTNDWATSKKIKYSQCGKRLIFYENDDDPNDLIKTKNFTIKMLIIGDKT